MADTTTTCLVQRSLMIRGCAGHESLARALARGIRAPWRYKTEGDDPGTPGWVCRADFVLVREPRDGLEEVMIWLETTLSGSLRLARIGSLTPSYAGDGIVEAFVEEVLRAAAAGADGIRWAMEDLYEGPSDWFTPTTVALLGRAIDRGGLERRWNDGWLEFLARVHIAEEEGLRVERLGPWLCETQLVEEPEVEKLMHYSRETLFAFDVYDALLKQRAGRVPAA